MTNVRAIDPERIQVEQWRRFALEAVEALRHRFILSQQEQELVNTILAYDKGNA